MSFQLENQPFSAIERMSDGLRAYFGRVYNYMAGGLALSGLMAYVTVHTPLIRAFYHVSPQGVSYSLLGWLAILSPLALILMISSSLNRLNTARAQGLFLALFGLNGCFVIQYLFLFLGSGNLSSFFNHGRNVRGPESLRMYNPSVFGRMGQLFDDGFDRGYFSLYRQFIFPVR